MNYYKSSLILENKKTKAEAFLFFYWKNSLSYNLDNTNLLDKIKEAIIENSDLGQADLYKVKAITQKKYEKAKSKY
jgi:hypothetical protein